MGISIRRDVVLIAIKFTFRFRLSQCTSEPTVKDANAPIVVNRSPGRGSCKVTSELIQVIRLETKSILI